MTLSAPIVGLIVKKTLRYKWATVICCLGPVLAMGLLTQLDEHSSPAVQWLSRLSSWFTPDSRCYSDGSGIQRSTDFDIDCDAQLGGKVGNRYGDWFRVRLAKLGPSLWSGTIECSLSIFLVASAGSSVQ